MVRSRNSGWVSLLSSVVLFCCIGLGMSADSSISSYQTESKPQTGNPNIVQSAGKTAKDFGNTVNQPSPANDPQQYRSAYYYPTQQHQQFAGGVPLWNRDSYADAASDFGYNTEGGHGQQAHGASYHSPAVPSGAYGAHDSGDGTF